MQRSISTEVKDGRSGRRRCAGQRRAASSAIRNAAALVCVAALAACGSGEQAAPPAPAPPVEEAPAPAPAPAPPVDEAPAPAPPREVDFSGGDAARGEAVYLANCASCHGPRGEGDGPVAATLDPRPANHADGTRMNALSDDYLAGVILHGGPSVGKSPMMAPFAGVLDEGQVADVVAYIRTLADPPYRP